MSIVSKNVYFDVLDNIFDEYNNTYHNTIKMKSIDVKSNSYVKYNVDSNNKDPKIKKGDHDRISKYENTFAKGYTPKWSEVFAISKIKNTVSWTYVTSNLNGEEIIETFCEKELQKTNQKEFRIGKVIKREGNSVIIHLIVGLKKTLYKLSQYFPKLNHAKLSKEIKADLKQASGIDTSKLELKSNLANLKVEIDKIDVDKLKIVPVNLSKLSNVVNNKVIKKTV